MSNWIKQYLDRRLKLKIINTENELAKKGAFPVEPDNRLSQTEILTDFRGSYIGGNHPRTISKSGMNSKKSIELKKIVVSPKQILDELERLETTWSLVGLEDKITLLKMKKELVTQSYSKRDVEAMIERLENRKKYNNVAKKKKTFAQYFRQFDTTSDEKIQKLLDKYSNLTMRDADIFVPEFPQEAIDIMTEMTEYFKLLCNKKPLFLVIATEENFQEKYKKRDPILLVQSPFGFYYYILGAWDKEMEYLPEL